MTTPPQAQFGPDGAQVLDEVHATLLRYVFFPSPEAADACVLYAAATHAVDYLEFATRLGVESPVKRCGKSRLLEMLSLLVRNPLKTVNISPAALVRSIETPRTIVFDETDAIFGKNSKGDEKTEMLRGILNAGFAQGSPYLRYDATAKEVEECPTFSMSIVAGIGSLPDTIEDRAVIIVMQRKPPGAPVAKFRTRRDAAAVIEIGLRLGEWMETVAEQVGSAYPELPPGLNDRAEDAWEALVAVADAAGGSWPERARRAAVTLSAEAEENSADLMQTRLLSDLRDIFMPPGCLPNCECHDKLHSTAIVALLRFMPEAPWRDWKRGRPEPWLNERELAEMLKDFRVKPKNVRIHNVQLNQDVQLKGYERSQFVAVWECYLPPRPGADGDPGMATDEPVDDPPQGGTRTSRPSRPETSSPQVTPGTANLNLSVPLPSQEDITDSKTPGTDGTRPVQETPGTDAGTAGTDSQNPSVPENMEHDLGQCPDRDGGTDGTPTPQQEQNESGDPATSITDSDIEQLVEGPGEDRRRITFGELRAIGREVQEDAGNEPRAMRSNKKK